MSAADMAVKWELVKVGETLWDVHKTRMGNTTMSRTASWPVRIIAIDYVGGIAQVSWNGGAPQRYSRHRVERLRRSPHPKVEVR